MMGVRIWEIMMAYTLHMETTDGTLERAFTVCSTKRAALRAAKLIAKEPSFDCVRLVVNDTNNMTVETFRLPQEPTP